MRRATCLFFFFQFKTQVTAKAVRQDPMEKKEVSLILDINVMSTERGQSALGEKKIILSQYTFSTFLKSKTIRMSDLQTPYKHKCNWKIHTRPDEQHYLIVAFLTRVRGF